MGNIVLAKAPSQSILLGKEPKEYYGTMTPQKLNNIKLMFMGPPSVGKTTFIDLYVNQDYLKKDPTMGVDHTVITKNDIDYHIYDTTGIREYRHILRPYYNMIDAYVIMIEHDNMDYRNIISEFYNDIAKHKKKTYAVYLVINIKNKNGMSQNMDMSNHIIELCKKLDDSIIVYKLDVMNKYMTDRTMETLLDGIYKHSLI